MSQALVLKVQDSAEVLWQAFQRSTCAVERRRIQLIALLTEGKSKAEVRAVTRYSDPAYCKAIERYNAQGLSGLRDLRHDNLGPPSLLSDDQMLLLAQQIRFDFAQSTLWDGAKVIAWLEQNFGLEVHPGRAYEFLAQVGLILQGFCVGSVQSRPVILEGLR